MLESLTSTFRSFHSSSMMRRAIALFSCSHGNPSFGFANLCWVCVSQAHHLLAAHNGPLRRLILTGLLWGACRKSRRVPNDLHAIVAVLGAAVYRVNWD